MLTEIIFIVLKLRDGYLSADEYSFVINGIRN